MNNKNPGGMPDGGDQTRVFSAASPEKNNNNTGGRPKPLSGSPAPRNSERTNKIPQNSSARRTAPGIAQPGQASAQRRARNIYARRDLPMRPTADKQAQYGANRTGSAPLQSGGEFKNTRAPADTPTKIMPAVPPDMRQKDSVRQNNLVSATYNTNISTAAKRPAASQLQTRGADTAVKRAVSSSSVPAGVGGNIGRGGARIPASGRRRRSGGGQEVTGALSSVMKAIVYIVFVLVISGFLSYFGITVCNDVFAFVKSEKEAEITIPEYATIDDVASALKKNGIIRYPSIFKLYASLRHDSGEYVAGIYTVTPSMNYDMLLSSFKEQVAPRSEVSVTIPEGYTIDEIIDLFVSKGMGTREGFVDAIQNADFSDYSFNWFIKEIESTQSSYRKYRLEGYLFPDTYYFYSDSKEETIIYKMLVNFNKKFEADYTERCKSLGYTVDQLITLASMIQAEAKFSYEYPVVSSVFHNRLDNPGAETVGRLESDPTLLYLKGDKQALITQDDKLIDNPYNTYLYKGLPPGPICNPSLDAIQYALYPDTTKYFYFVAKKDGTHLFAATLAEHTRNILEADGQ